MVPNVGILWQCLMPTYIRFTAGHRLLVVNLNGIVLVRSPDIQQSEVGVGTIGVYKTSYFPWSVFLVEASGFKLPGMVVTSPWFARNWFKMRWLDLRWWWWRQVGFHWHRRRWSRHPLDRYNIHWRCHRQWYWPEAFHVVAAGWLSGASWAPSYTQGQQGRPWPRTALVLVQAVWW